MPLFVNGDLIAAGLSPFNPEGAAIAAGRVMLARLDELARRGESFAFKTTLASHSYVKRIMYWQKRGYHIAICFLSLPNVETAVARVAERVRMGGHDVPEEVVKRRYVAGRENFNELCRTIVDSWVVFDNSGASPALMEWGGRE